VNDLLQIYLEHPTSSIDIPLDSGALDLITSRFPPASGSPHPNKGISVQLEALPDGLRFVNSVTSLHEFAEAKRRRFFELCRMPDDDFYAACPWLDTAQEKSS
jgi:hypothetical protein